MVRDKGYLVFLLSKYNYNKYSKIINKIINDIEKNINQLLNSDFLGIDNQEQILWIIYDLMPSYNKNKIAKNLVDKLRSIVFNKSFIDFWRIYFNKLPSYWKVMFGTRIIMSFSSYYGDFYREKVKKQLIYRWFNFIYLQNINLQKVSNLMKEKFYTDIIKEWIKIKIISLEELSGGFSGAKVLRIRANLIIPGFVNSSLPSLIVKISEKESLYKERENYEKIPDWLKGYFAKIPDQEFPFKMGENFIRF